MSDRAYRRAHDVLAGALDRLEYLTPQQRIRFAARAWALNMPITARAFLQ